MKFSSVLSITLLLSACFFLPTIHGKRSFGVSRRAKTHKSYSARRGDGRNSQPDHHDPIPKPAAPPKGISKSEPPLSKSSAHQSNTNPSAPAQPGWNVNNQHPAGPPPAYPGLGHNSAPAHGMPPAYSPSYNKPPAYSQYPNQPYSAPGAGMSPYGNTGYQQPMGNMGYQQPMGNMGYQQPMGMGGMGMGGMGMMGAPQRSSGGGLSVGSMLAGMAVGGMATHLVGGIIPRRQVTEQHIHHYDHSDKDDTTGNAAAVPQQPQEGLAPLVTPDPVLLANPEQPHNQFNENPEDVQPPPIEPIYSFNYAPAYVQHTAAPPTDQIPQESESSETTSQQPTEDTPS